MVEIRTTVKDKKEEKRQKDSRQKDSGQKDSGQQKNKMTECTSAPKPAKLILNTNTIPNIEERRLSCSRTEFRPIHTEIIRRKLLRDFLLPGSLPFNIRSYKSKEDIGYESPSCDSLAEMERFLSRRNSVPIHFKSNKDGGGGGLDSGIGSSPEKSPRTSKTDKIGELMFNIEL